MRVALYYTPDAGHQLTLAAAEWLGRSPFAAQDRVGSGAPGSGRAGSTSGCGPEQLIAAPRRYGFHATLKAPFQLTEGRTLGELADALAGFCQARAAPPLGPFQIKDLGEFIALVPDGPRPELEDVAAAVVREFDAFRAPLGEAELARRRSGGLTARQDEYLREWGYPHVFDEFRFHMTLTGRVPEDRRAAVISLLHDRFNALLDSTPALDGIAMFVEPERQADFEVHRLFRLGTGQGCHD